jgi:glucose dehydrogenase
MSIRHLDDRKQLLLISTLSIAAILALSSAVVTPIRAAPASNGGDWTGVDGIYPYNWDYSNQTQITPANAANLQLKWIFPMPAPPANCIRCGGLVLTPIVVGGIVYGLTDSQYIFALNAATGGVLWTKQLPLPTYGGIVSYANYVGKPPYPTSLGLQGHYHAFWYTTHIRGQPLIWVVANNYTVYSFNANTGTPVLKFNLLNQNDKLPGNFGLYVSIVPQMAVDDKSGLAVFGSDVSEGTTAGRGFFAGYDLNANPPQKLWTQFVIPPQDGSDQNWAINSVKNMDYAYTFDGAKQIDLKALSASQMNSVLSGDWGKFGFDGTRSYAGAGAGWGGTYAEDPATGIAYVATSQASPDWNATYRPGPNLWSDSIMAINMRTGHIIWTFQTTAHDLWDWDCAWSVMLATVNGHEVVMKGCKNGYFYQLDAATGKMLWMLNPQSIKRLPNTVLLNPLDPTAMTKPWQNYPSTGPYIQNPPGTGGIESDPAYDPKTNMAFVAAYNAPSNQQTHDVGPESPWGVSGQTSVPGYVRHYNTTIYAMDAVTGAVKWTYFIDNVGFRGGITASNGMLFVPSVDGHIYILNEADGSVIGKFFTGSAMITQPAFAADVNGQTTMFIPGSGAPAYSFTIGIGTVPGYLAAFAAPNAPTQSVTTVTQSAATTSAGIDPTLFYGVSAIAVVAIIVAGVALATRRRPAS